MSRGNEDAWREFHQQFFQRLHRYLIVLQRGDDESAAELVQLTLLRVVRHVRRFDDDQVFWSWLTCLARCAAADEGRKRTRRSRVLEKFAHWQEIRRTGFLPHEAKLESMETCLAALPPDDRALVEGKYFERQTYEQLADSFGLTPKAVESKLSRLRKKLRFAIESASEHQLD